MTEKTSISSLPKKDSLKRNSNKKTPATKIFFAADALYVFKNMDKLNLTKILLEARSSKTLLARRRHLPKDQSI